MTEPHRILLVCKKCNFLQYFVRVNPNMIKPQDAHKIFYRCINCSFICELVVERKIEFESDWDPDEEN